MRGGRFNPKGVPALYLSLDVMTAIKEANQGFAHKIEPCTLCCYDVDCDRLADATTETGRAEIGVAPNDLDCAWFALAADGKEPPSWALARRLIGEGWAGILVPSFAPGARAADRNLVFWRRELQGPNRVAVFDPNGRLTGRGSQ